MDPICNHVGNSRWVHELDWSGQEGFGKAEMKRFVIDTKDHSTDGDVKSFGGLTFIAIDNVDHMVCFKCHRNLRVNGTN
jgi:carboxypeptidase C (cathepsin A)